MRPLLWPIAALLLVSPVMAEEAKAPTTLERALVQARKIRATAESAITKTPEYRAWQDADTLVKQLESLVAEKAAPAK